MCVCVCVSWVEGRVWYMCVSVLRVEGRVWYMCVAPSLYVVCMGGRWVWGGECVCVCVGGAGANV